MRGLSPEARSIIEAARGGDEPTPQDRTRIRSSLIVRVGAGMAAASAATSAESGAAAAGAAKAAAPLLAGFIPKGIIVLSAVGAIGIGSYVANKPSIPPAAQQTAIAAPITSFSATSEAESAPVVGTAEAEDEEPVHEAISVPAAATVEVHEDAAPNLAAEVESLREAHTALREGRADEAMDVLQRDAAPSDVSGLEQERAAMRVFALCRLGKSEEARTHAAAFLARWPKSPLAARVSEACVRK